MKSFFIIPGCLLVCLCKTGYTQQKVVSRNQVWLGYMTTVPIDKKYSLWNDVHLVPGGFFLIRTGITRNYDPLNVTMGYAYGRLPVSSTNSQLSRVEHRPWAQVQSVLPLQHNFVFIPRIRYDARFRQDLSNGELLNSYSFVNRIRFMATLRKNLSKTETSIGRIFISLGNELLLNFGRKVTFNHFDQYRLSLLAGTQYKNMQFQFGYMNRFVKTGQDQFTQNHTMIIWFTQRFRQKMPVKKHEVELDGE